MSAGRALGRDTLVQPHAKIHSTIEGMFFRLVACFIAFAFISTAQQVIREAPISQFSQLPKPVRQDLQMRGCTVPQSPGSRRLENVIRGHFRNSRGLDWAVLCDVRKKNISMILIYWAGDAGKSTVLPNSRGRISTECWGSISTVGKSFILEHYRAYGGPPPPPLNHQGIDVGICEKASIVFYFYRNHWLTLTGSD